MIPQEALKPLTARYKDYNEENIVVGLNGAAFAFADVYFAPPGSVREARARLLVAAPDLYKILKRIVDEWDAGAFKDFEWILDDWENIVVSMEDAREALLLAERPIGGAV